MFSASPSRLSVRRVKMTPTLASEPTMRIPVIAMAQPPIQPNHGPIARVTQENVVPQSGSTRFSAAKAAAMSSIGRNDARSTPGALTPVSATSAPRIAASEYAGDVEASPITSASTKPMAPGRRVGSPPGSTAASRGWPLMRRLSQHRAPDGKGLALRTLVRRRKSWLG